MRKEEEKLKKMPAGELDCVRLAKLPCVVLCVCVQTFVSLTSFPILVVRLVICQRRWSSSLVAARQSLHRKGT